MNKDSHVERILCPNCKHVVSATVSPTIPFWSYVHECRCGYIITESDWQKYEESVEYYEELERGVLGVIFGENVEGRC